MPVVEIADDVKDLLDRMQAEGMIPDAATFADWALRRGAEEVAEEIERQRAAARWERAPSTLGDDDEMAERIRSRALEVADRFQHHEDGERDVAAG